VGSWARGRERERERGREMERERGRERERERGRRGGIERIVTSPQEPTHPNSDTNFMLGWAGSQAGNPPIHLLRPLRSHLIALSRLASIFRLAGVGRLGNREINFPPF